MKPDIYIGVGSNLEPQKNILLALEMLMARVEVTAASSFYRTKSLPRAAQPDFINGVWQVRSHFPARELKFQVLRQIEAALGRQRLGDKYAARPIDLDLLLYGSRVIRDPGLQVPDTDIYTRNFIAIPLFEIDPGLLLPGGGRSLAEVATSMNRQHMLLLPGLSSQIKALIRGQGKAGGNH